MQLFANDSRASLDVSESRDALHLSLAASFASDLSHRAIRTAALFALGSFISTTTEIIAAETRATERISQDSMTYRTADPNQYWRPRTRVSDTKNSFVSHSTELVSHAAQQNEYPRARLGMPLESSPLPETNNTPVRNRVDELQPLGSNFQRQTDPPMPSGSKNVEAGAISRHVPASPWERPTLDSRRTTEYVSRDAYTDQEFDRRNSPSNNSLHAVNDGDREPSGRFIRQPKSRTTSRPADQLPNREFEKQKSVDDNDFETREITIELSSSERDRSFSTGRRNRGLPDRSEQLNHRSVSLGRPRNVTYELERPAFNSDETLDRSGYESSTLQRSDDVKVRRLPRFGKPLDDNFGNESLESDQNFYRDPMPENPALESESGLREADRSPLSSPDSRRKAARVYQQSEEREQDRIRYAKDLERQQASDRELFRQEDETIEDFPYSTRKTTVIPVAQVSHQALENRYRTASRVSTELLDNETPIAAKAPLPVEPPEGWRSVESTLKQHLVNCDDLLRRGAVLSAREEVAVAIRKLFRAIDVRSGVCSSEPAMEQALAAFEEELDFCCNEDRATHSNTEKIVAGHKTLALKSMQLHRVSPELAAQHYRRYAREQWLLGAQSHPWAADLLYAYGKTLERESDNQHALSFARRSQAVVCYEASMAISPSHADTATQLGNSLLKLDRLQESESALKHAWQLTGKPETLVALSEVYKRTNQRSSYQAIEQQIAAIQSSASTQVAPGPDVVEVDPQTFARMSPPQYGMPISGPANAVQRYSQLPANNASLIAQPQFATASAVVPASATQPTTTNGKNSWFGKMFR